ncbi:hypothetical protein D3C74_368900 [compost metagenome]
MSTTSLVLSPASVSAPSVSVVEDPGVVTGGLACCVTVMVTDEALPVPVSSTVQTAPTGSPSSSTVWPSSISTTMGSSGP